MKMSDFNIPKSRVLVTGACGSVGSALVERLIQHGHHVCAFDNDEDGLFQLNNSFKSSTDNLRLFLGDIRDKERVKKGMERVEYVFHCAALKHVYISEYNPFEAIQTNVIGTNNVIDAALDSNVLKVIFTSSDKAVNPTSAMGASKLLAERLILSANGYVGFKPTRFSSVRFGNVLNSNGSILKIFEKQTVNGEMLTITSPDMTRFFLTMNQAVDLCLETACNMCGGEIFIKNMGACDILTLAKAYSKNEGAFEYREIGIKPGEKMWEELVTDAEVNRTVYDGSTYIILPDLSNSWPDEIQKSLTKYQKLRKVKKALRSDQNLMSVDDAKNMIDDASI